MLYHLFGAWNNNMEIALNAVFAILEKLLQKYKSHSIERNVLYNLREIFGTIEALNQNIHT